MLSRGQQKGLEKAISRLTRKRRTRRLGLICFRRRESTAAEPPQLQLPCILCENAANIENSTIPSALDASSSLKSLRRCDCWDVVAFTCLQTSSFGRHSDPLPTLLSGPTQWTPP